MLPGSFCSTFLPLLLLELQAFTVSHNFDPIARFEFAIEQFEGEGIEDEFLNRAFQRARAELRIESLARQKFFRGLIDLQNKLLLRQPLLQSLQLDFDNFCQLFFIKAVKDDDVVDAI